MEILQLKYFRMAAKKENISHAAQTFMVPPSSVSSAIKKLEKELGVTLFERTSNSLKLNECGRIFLNAIETAEDEFNKAKIEMLNLSDMPKGEIKMLILTNRRIVTDIISKFKIEYPSVSFSIKHDDYGDYGSYHKFDIIISDRNIDSLHFEKNDFVNEEVYLAVPVSSEISAVNGSNAPKLKNEKFICMPNGSSHRELMNNWFRQMELEPEIVIECDDPNYICEYLKMGMGSTFFPSVSWQNQLDERIRLLKIKDGIYRRSYMYINKDSSKASKLFAGMLELKMKRKKVNE